MAAVKKNGGALAYASEELQNNFDIVMAAVSNCEDALYYASDELRSQFITELIKDDARLFKFVSNLDDKKFIADFIKMSFYAKKYIKGE